MSNNSPDKDFDVVVIGAGVGGLTAAALLARTGLSVCVVEMDTRPGGYLAGFKRMDFRFDSAIHWLNQCGPEGMVTKVFDLIGSDHPKPKSQKKIKRFIGKSFNYLLTDRPDDLKDQWIKEFPHEKDGLIRFFEDAKKLGRSFDKASELFRASITMTPFEKMKTGIRRLKFALPFIKHISYKGDEGVRKGLNRYFKEERLHQVFCSEPDVLSCLVPFGWAYYKDYQSPPEGGSQVIPEWLQHVVEELGGTVKFRTKVTALVNEGTICTAVETIDKLGKVETISAKNVIAACDAIALYEQMFPTAMRPTEMIKRIKDSDQYASSVTVQLALDCPVESLGFNEEMIFLGDEGLDRSEYGNGDPQTAGISILAPSLRDPSMCPKGKGTVTIYVAAGIDYADHWKTELDAKGNRKRGAAYKEFKKQYADVLIKRVEKAFDIDITSHIDYCDIATPITHWRYTGNYGGTIMGSRPGKENMQSKVASYTTPLKNVFLGGHWAELGGGVPIAVKAASNASLLVLKQQNPAAFVLLSKYFDQDTTLQQTLNSDLLSPYSNAWKRAETPAEKKQI